MVLPYKPLLLKPEMALAIQEGLKIQHRILLQPQPKEVLLQKNGLLSFRGIVPNVWLSQEQVIEEFSPVGLVSEFLYVQTDWKTLPQWNHLSPKKLPSESKNHIFFAYEKEYQTWKSAKKRSARYLPASFSKIWLQVLGVSLVPIHHINELEAIAEGIQRKSEDGIIVYQDYTRKRKHLLWTKNAIESFKSLWVRTNGEKNWKQNPWVWVLQFKRVSSPL